MQENVIKCVYKELWDIERLKPNPKNPNKHSEKQIKRLAKNIKELGWRAVITVSSRSGLIVRGHARLEAAKILGCKQVPVDIQDYNSESEEMLDLLADNRIAELAEIDILGVKDIIQEFDTGLIDIELSGYNMDEIEELMTQFHVDIEEPKEKETKESNLIQCPKCGLKFEK